MVVEGLLKDDAGAVLEGDFQVTVSLYAAQDSADAAWSETLDALAVKGGFFQARLGMANKLEAGLFQQNAGLWIGVALEGQPEFPRTSLETDPYAYRAMSAASADALNCTGCVDQSHLGFSPATGDADGAALNAITAINADVAADIQCTGCVDMTALEVGVLAAGNISFDDTVAALGAETVQSALEKLKALVDEGGGGNGDVVEGAGSVALSQSNRWELSPFGSGRNRIHLFNPTDPKVLMFLHGDSTSSYSTGNNLVVAYDFAPNQYSAGLNGQAGEAVIQVTNPSIFNVGAHVLLYQTVGTGGNGTGAGTWELNAVKSIQGSTVEMVKPLVNNYVDKGENAAGDNEGQAQAVIAASYNNLELVSGGHLKPSKSLTEYGDEGGIVYVRAQTVTVKAGGKITANGFGFDQYNDYKDRGGSECHARPTGDSANNNCSGGGGTQNDNYCSGGGGGNKTAGAKSTNIVNCSSGNAGKGGTAKGDAEANILTLGGAGGNGYHYHQTSNGKPADSGRGGGLIVIGAKTLKVESGGLISANGIIGGYGGGGGGGGTVALFVENLINEGTVESKGGAAGPKYNGSESLGGVGGEGWVHQLAPITGIINESYPKGVKVLVDGTDVTATLGDPNGKGSPHWNAENKLWGDTGLVPWSSGPLDLTGAANWTLGEHTITLEETGGAGGLLESYVYVIYPFTESTPPPNNSCGSPVLLDPNTEAVVISGTTEDTMGKTLATDDSKQAGCGGDSGPDVVYKIELAQRSLIHANVVAPFASKLYIRSDNCTTGEMVYCAQTELTTTPLEPGDYYLFVDSDAEGAKGNFTLGVSTTPAPLPTNDTCATAMTLNFGLDGIATHDGTSLYGLDQYKGLCPAPNNLGADTIYELDAGTGQTLTATVTADFDAVLYITTMQCGANGIPLGCSKTGSLTLQGLAGGKYWLYVDGTAEKEWGTYNLSVSLTTPGQ
jgi:hypothetical protein